MGRKARAWAEEAFDIAAIGNRVHTILVSAAAAKMIERLRQAANLTLTTLKSLLSQKNSSN
jgi:hypothetical protein